MLNPIGVSPKFPQPSTIPTQGPRWDVVVLAGLLTVAAAMLLNGYAYGSDDHLGLLPMFKAMTRPGLYANDWFIQAEREMNVRYFYLRLLSAAAWPIGLPAASFLMYLACGVLLYAALARMASLFIEENVVALLAAATAMLSPIALELGQSKLLSNQMLPNLIAYALAAWALYAAMRDRPMAAGLCLGAATLMQGLIGVLASILVFGTLLGCHGSAWRRRWPAWLIGMLTCLAIAAPNIILVLSAESTRELGNHSLMDFFIFARLRVPHHVLPGTWPGSAWIAGGLMLLCVLLCSPPAKGGLGGVFSRMSPLPNTPPVPPFAGGVIWTPVTILLTGFALGVVFVEIIPTIAVAKLQLFRGMTFFRVFAVIGLFHGLARGRPSSSFRGWGVPRACLLSAACVTCLHESLWLWVGPVWVTRLAISEAAARWSLGATGRRWPTELLDAACIVLTIVAVTRLAAVDVDTAEVIAVLGVAILLSLLVVLVGPACRAGPLRSSRYRNGSSGGNGNSPAPVAARTIGCTEATAGQSPLPRWFAPAAACGMALGFLAITPLPAGPLASSNIVAQVWRQFRLAVPDDRPRNAAQRAGVWASRRLPPDAVVLIEPGLKDFRYRSERAVVVDFKGVPFTTEGLREWRRRLYDVCGLASDSTDAQSSPPDLYGAFDRLTGIALAKTAVKYGADYLVVSRAVDGPWRLLHREKDQHVYARLNDKGSGFRAQGSGKGEGVHLAHSEP